MLRWCATDNAASGAHAARHAAWEEWNTVVVAQTQSNAERARCRGGEGREREKQSNSAEGNAASWGCANLHCANFACVNAVDSSPPAA